MLPVRRSSTRNDDVHVHAVGRRLHVGRRQRLLEEAEVGDVLIRTDQPLAAEQIAGQHDDRFADHPLVSDVVADNLDLVDRGRRAFPDGPAQIDQVLPVGGRSGGSPPARSGRRDIRCWRTGSAPSPSPTPSPTGCTAAGRPPACRRRRPDRRGSTPGAPRSRTVDSPRRRTSRPRIAGPRPRSVEAPPCPRPNRESANRASPGNRRSPGRRTSAAVARARPDRPFARRTRRSGTTRTLRDEWPCA